MSRPTTKPDLILAAQTNFENLMKMIDSMTPIQRSIDFDFSNDEKRKEAHWNRDKNLRDVYIHLYEWHQLLLNWVEANKKGESYPFILSPYNWKTYGKMNEYFLSKHHDTLEQDAREMVEKSHDDVMLLAKQFNNEELFSKNAFKWVGGSTLGSYFVSASASHYEWAIKKLKAHIKHCNTI